MNRLRRQGERPSKYIMAMVLQQRGWRRCLKKPQEHEPTYWADPLGCVGPQGTFEAWELQRLRDRAALQSADKKEDSK